MKAVSVRTIALALTLSVLLTSALIGAWLIHRSWAAQRDLMEAQLVRLAQTLADSVDRELASGMRMLQAITLRLPDGLAPAQSALRERAAGLLDLSPNLEAIALNDPAGEQIWNTRLQAGQRSARRVFEHERQAVATMKPLVAGLYRSRSTNDLIASYVVPVVLAGSPRVLVGSLALDRLVERLQPLATKEGAIAALIDAQGRIVARTGERGWLGEELNAQWKPALSARPEGGLTPVVTREGIDSYGAWARLPGSGWTVMIAVPSGPHGQALRTGLVLQSLAAGLLAAVGTLLSYSLGRAMVRRARRLASQAQGLVVHRDLSAAPTGIIEFDTIQRGLVEAAALLQERDARARELEQAQVELLARERTARQDAEEANRFKDESLGVLGHEMRNPLAAIVNAAQVLENRLSADGHGTRMVQTIQRQARALTRLVNDLLEVGRVISGHLPLELRRIDLGDVVREAVEVLRLCGTQASHRLDLQLQPAFVYGDFDRLQQVVTNLLTNATRYSPAGSTIHVGVQLLEAGVELRVRDEGVGLRGEDLDRIFALFVQVGQRARNAGLGIGLSVVKRLVELHGGRVRAESAGPGQGATFIATFPLAQS